MKKFLIKAWNYVDDHKTIIFMTSATIMQRAISYDIIKDSKGINFTIWILTLLGGGSLVHHVKKSVKKRKQL